MSASPCVQLQVALLLGCALWLPRSARAYGDPFVFNDSVLAGGGGGRWFTGSPADGFSCSVCHVGPAAEGVVVAGLPAQYQLGATYDLIVGWPPAYAKTTAIVELNDRQGRGAGSLALPEAAAMQPSELCAPVEQGIPAAIVFDEGAGLGLAPGRALGVMQDCGGSALHLRWRAPSADVGAVLFAGGVVQGDGANAAQGDRATQLSYWIAASNDPGGGGEILGACAVKAAGARAPQTPPWLALGCALVLLVSRSRGAARRRSDPAWGGAPAALPMGRGGACRPDD